VCDNRTVTNPDFVLSLARGLQVIEAFEDRPDGVTVGDVAERTGLSRAAARRFLITLELLGYATHTGPIYRLTSRVLRLGFSYLSSSSISALSAPILEEISAKIGESASISTLEGTEIIYLARSATRRVMSVGLSIGSRLPAYCTSMGRVLLAARPDLDLDHLDIRPLTPKTITDRERLRAELRRVAEQGYCLVDEELEVGLRSLAVPIRNRAGVVVAAMNTGVHASRVTAAEMIERFLPVLRAGALTLAARLSYS
jgi:IclR family pca regulon transcriptional regulator